MPQILKMSDLKQWAEWFGISVKEVNRWCAKGIIPASRSSSRQHWKAPFTAKATQTAYANWNKIKGWEKGQASPYDKSGAELLSTIANPAHFPADIKLLRPYRQAFRVLDCASNIAKRAQVYAIAAAIDRAEKRETISHLEMDKFRYVTRHWLKHKNPEAEKKECLSADLAKKNFFPAYKTWFPLTATYDYARKNPKEAELVAAIMLADNASNAGEKMKLTISAVRSEWNKVVGQKPAHGQPRFIEANDCFRLNREDPSRAAFNRRFSKNLIRQAFKVAMRKLGNGSTEFEGLAGDSKDIAWIFAEASNQPASPKASKFHG